MKCRFPIVALAVASIAIQDRLSATAATVTTVGGGAAAAGVGGSGGTGKNWFLKRPDGSSQGPYGLAQLLDWSNAGYVPPDSQVRWGMSGTPQPLSTVLRNDDERRGRFAGNALYGGDRARLQDDASSEERGYEYRAATQQLWQAQGGGEDSEDEEFVMRRRVTAVEGGRWAESVAAARSILGSILKVRRTSRRRSRSAAGGRGGRYPQGGRGGPGSHQERPPYGSNTGPRYGGPQGTSRMRDHPRVGGSEEWIPDARRAPGQGQGRGDEWGSLNNLGVNVDAGDSRGAPPQPPVEASAGEQRSAGAPGEDGARETGGSFYPPPPPLRPPPPPPSPHLPSGSDWAQEGGRQTPWGGDDHSRGDDGGILANPSHAGVETPYPQPSLPQQEQQQQHQQLLSEKSLPRSGEDDDGYLPRFSEDLPGSGMPPSSGFSRVGMASEGAPSASGELNPKDVEDFYASQQLDHDNGDRDRTYRGEPSKVSPRKKKRWGRRANDLSREELRSLGLNYGDSDSAGPSEGRRGAQTGKIAVTSIKLRYMEGWRGEAEKGGSFATLRGLIGSSISAVFLPIKAVACLTPVGAARVLARAVGVIPLFLWFLFSVAMGALPATVAWFGSRLLAKLSEVTAGRYTFSPAEFSETRSACLKLTHWQISAGLALTLMAGIEQAWLRPVARKRSAVLAHRALAHVYVAEGRVDDRPSAAEFRELSLTPWAFTCEAMKLWRALTGVAAAAAFLHLVWPVRGPAALGGGAAVVLLMESLSLWLSGAPDRAAGDSHAAFAEELASFAQGGTVASSEAEARGLRQVLLERRSSLLEAASEGLPKERKRHRRGIAASVPAGKAIRGLLAWAAGGLGVAYVLLAVVEEELAFHFGGDRIVLAAAQTWLAHSSLHRALRSLGQLAILRPSAARMNALVLKGTDGLYPETGFARKGRDSGPATKGGWTNDGPEVSDGLRLEGVALTPRGRKMPALSGIDLHAPAGSVVAVVGGAGAGKTCLLQLVLGLVKADAGGAKFQGRPLEEWETSAYRERVAWLNQVATRFALTAGENIGAGDPAAFSDRRRWETAAGMSGASVAIESLPMGYDTPLEDGGGPGSATSSTRPTVSSGLSEGEWQRVQLSRFFMRADAARLLLLDEPFKGIDPVDASRMLAGLRAQAQATGQVVIVASQDFSIGRWADMTVLLENGSVREAGSWDEMLARGGSFAAAVREQNAL